MCDGNLWRGEVPAPWEAPVDSARGGLQAAVLTAAETELDRGLLGGEREKASQDQAEAILD